RELKQDLLRVAIEETVGRGRVDRDGGEEPGRQRAPGATDAVHRPDIERVINMDPLAQLNSEVAEEAGAEPDHDRAHYVDEAGGRGDRHQAGHGAGGRAQHARLTLV